MPNQPPVWGPHHQQGLPGGIQLSGGGYWWGITTGCWLAFFAFLGMNSGTGGQASAAAVIVVMTAAAAAVGWGEAQHGKRFASGRWVLFASATVASSAAYFLPAMAYVGGYFVQQQHARQQRSPKIARGAPPANATTRKPSAPTSPVALAAAQRQTPAPPAPASVPVVAGGYFGVDARGQVVAASARGAALVIGPPESGQNPVGDHAVGGLCARGGGVDQHEGRGVGRHPCGAQPARQMLAVRSRRHHRARRGDRLALEPAVRCHRLGLRPSAWRPG